VAVPAADTPELLVDKHVQAQAMGAVFDSLLDPGR
jgi:hypothetical protein